MIDPTRPDFANTPASLWRPRFEYALVDISVPPCVTIVTPFYNPGMVFLDTARSVLNQSLQQWEWLIVNDGSTDAESLALLDDYRSCDPCIRVIDHLVNRGLSAARNTGFASARAPYVVQLDSDDLLEPTAVEKWAWFLESYPEFFLVKGYSVGFGAHEYLWPKGFEQGSAFLEANMVNPTSMIRTTVHQVVGGYDETDRGGLMDWDFWLRCANAGYWGGTIPEYLDWYRRRPTHTDRWPDFDEGKRRRAYGAKLRHRYPRLWNGGFPCITLREDSLLNGLPQSLPWENLLTKGNPRLALLVDEIMPDATVLLTVVQQFTQAGWNVSVIGALAGDLSAVAQYARYTPDVFVLPHFLREQDYPRFLHYFLASRQTDVVLNAASAFGYLLLPDLRWRFPHVTWVGLWGSEGPDKEKNLLLSASEIGVRLCDAHLGVTQETYAWLTAHGVEVSPMPLQSADSSFPLLVKEAMRRHAEQPRSLSENAVGTMSVALAVAVARLEDRSGSSPAKLYELHSPLLDVNTAPWHAFLYPVLRRLILPYYRILFERHKKWLLLIKDTLKRVFMR